MIVIETIDHIALQVKNIEKGIEFYRDIFGFDVVEHLSGSPDALLQVGDIRIRLISSSSANKSEGYIAFYLDEEDFEDALEEIEENEISLVAETEEYRGGKRVVVQDPDGNHIALCYTRK